MKTSLAPSETTELTAWVGDNFGLVKQGLVEAGLVLFRGYDTRDAATLKKMLARYR